MSNVVIAGASRGIGLALTKRFAALGHRVFASAREPARATALSGLAASAGGKVVVIALDVDSDESVKRAAEEVRSRTSSIDVLVNMAGIAPGPNGANLETVTAEDFRSAFETNVLGPARTTSAFVSLLRAASRPARVVHVSSGLASISGKDSAGFYAYGVSKAALNMLSRTQSFDLQAAGIIVIALDPGWVRTDLGGPNAHLAPEESAEACAKTILDLTPASTGKFFHYSGSELAY